MHSRSLGCMLATALIVAAGGCKSIDGTSPALIPNKALAVSRSLSIPMDTMLLAAAVVVVVDPLAPNWHIEEHPLGEGRYAYALTKKRFTTGGDGEAMPVLRRRLDQLARAQGRAGYAILAYTESIDSKVPVAQRVARATVQFEAVPAAKAAQVPK